MKTMHGRARKNTTFSLCVLMATLLFGSAVASADVVLDWNVIAVNTAIANGQNPFAQARYAAIVQLAVFEAVNAITGDYQPYLGTIVRRPAPQPTQQPSRLRIGCSAPISQPARRRSTPRARTRWRRYRTARPRMTASRPAMPQPWP